VHYLVALSVVLLLLLLVLPYPMDSVSSYLDR
jgi:hypothetical protein